MPIGSILRPALLWFALPLLAADRVTIEGTIRDAAGNPIPNLTLELFSEPYQDPGWTPDAPITGVNGRISSIPKSPTIGPRLKSDRYARTRTSATGSFRVECKLKHQDRTLELRFKRLQQKPREIPLTGPHTRVDITLP